MMEQEEVRDTIGQARHSLFGCNNKRGDKRQRENSTDEDRGEVQENDWDENYECDSNISYFEDEMDRLLDPEENKDCWTEPSETVDGNGAAVTETRGREDSLSNGTEVIELRVGSDSPPCRTAVIETRGKDDSPPKVTVSSQSRVRFPSSSSLIDSDFKEELDQLMDQEEDEDGWTEHSETVDGNDSPSNGTDSSQPRVRGSSPLSTEASESSEEDEDTFSFETEAIETRASKKRKTISSPKGTQKKGQKKARPPSSPLWLSSPAKSRRNAHAATPLIIVSERRWKTEDEPDQEPKLFPFEPARTPGPQLDTSKNYTVLELFQLFFSNDIVDTLCSNTNKNAKRRHEQGFKPVSVEEMYNYLSIVIYMGLLNVHTVSDYWVPNRLYGIPFCRTVMTMTRFRAITYSLHMSDPAEDEENDKKKGTAGYDRLMRIKPLKDQILAACRAFYHPFQNLSIDERAVRSKARHGLKQYIKSKPYRYGFKLYVLADSRNGYTCDFNVFMSKNPSASGKGESYDAVMDLLNIPHLGTGYHIYVDNYFTSATLFRDLYKNKLGACGTIRENRVGLAGVQENSMPPRAKRGTIRWLRDGELLFTKWMDARPVIMCTTIHKAFAKEQVQRRKRLEDGTWTTEPVPAPAPIKSYNKYMGGVDLSDSLIKCYSVAQKTMKWYKTFFYHFVDVAVVNSWLMHKDMAVTKNTKPMAQKQFREKLCSQLADIALKGDVQEERGEEQKEQPSEQRLEKQGEKHGEKQDEKQGEEEEEVEVGLLCCPVPTKDPITVALCNKASEGRRQCHLCKHKTIWQCESCKVALCIIPDRNCFRIWHVKKDNDEQDSS
ncbi:piggyBac transposable element-derived protein 4-like [Salvelinus namaycush]|uniref:PiggyBac transposable element-derived protein 4-like n=1 Tax=Salvelinus namaycush TaxID=8040 RepID=A0A8U0TL33_SALNM|nr:piggyBac transposable element-derived protein 4-like [Salvelinus namaycush]XP_038820024.1 piggyBac transposable element-derived protein 4-like [Salvelinus namaycush]XP_038820025.1 piggyBac transposable element-derived protein 4-like [Salvelinus namaycush]